DGYEELITILPYQKDGGFAEVAWGAPGEDNFQKISSAGFDFLTPNLVTSLSVHSRCPGADSLGLSEDVLLFPDVVGLNYNLRGVRSLDKFFEELMIGHAQVLLIGEYDHGFDLVDKEGRLLQYDGLSSSQQAVLKTIDLFLAQGFEVVLISEFKDDEQNYIPPGYHQFHEEIASRHVSLFGVFKVFEPLTNQSIVAMNQRSLKWISESVPVEKGTKRIIIYYGGTGHIQDGPLSLVSDLSQFKSASIRLVPQDFSISRRRVVQQLEGIEWDMTLDQGGAADIQKLFQLSGLCQEEVVIHDPYLRRDGYGYSLNMPADPEQLR
ncbi:MAG: hypothetical protein Q7S00_02000, partial [bacterium]|nr:hypothetical protein [bacterium]